MTKRLPSAEIYRITRSDIHQGIEAYRAGQRAPGFVESTRFDLLVDCEYRLPPKAIVGLAGLRSHGRYLRPEDFSGGESSPAFRVLWDRGFEIVTKMALVSGLDASFSVGRGPEGSFLLLESSGGGRNPDYLPALEALLYGLAGIDAMLDQIEVDSRVSRALPHDARVVEVVGWAFPLPVRSIDDIPTFRLAVTNAVAQTARDPGSSSGGGNPTKRLRIYFQVPDDLSLFETRELLGSESTPPTHESETFVFTPSAPGDATDKTIRSSIGATEVSHLHSILKKGLYGALVAEFGADRVGAECRTAAGRPADLIVETERGYVTYEIKTAHSARDCVRQALGQLLEYSSWPGSGKVAGLCVVGPAPADPLTLEYIEVLNSTYGLPLRYLHQPIH